MRRTGATAAAVSSVVLCATAAISDAYVPTQAIIRRRQDCSADTSNNNNKGSAFAFRKRPNTFLNMVYAPPGSGYLDRDDEVSIYPDTYDPMMEYPGTMRPGKTKENQAFENLPLADSDPDPVPWPHFQEIEWHHLWEPPHPHSTPMEEFIDQHGRWSSAEEEAQMRMEARRGVRERRDQEEVSKTAVSTLIVDIEDDDDEDEGPQLDLGQGVGSLFGDDDEGDDTEASAADGDEDEEEDEGDDTDFLLDLGLDVEGGDLGDDETADDEDGDDILNTLSDMLGADTTVTGDDDDLDLDVDLNDLEEDMGDDMGGDDDVTMIGGGEDDGFDTVSLDDYSDNEDMGEEDSFDDGGFDYDEGGDGGGGDMDGW